MELKVVVSWRNDDTTLRVGGVNAGLTLSINDNIDSTP